MYRRPKFLEVLHEIREEMSRQADYDVDLFVEMIRSEQVFDIEVKLVTEDNSNGKPDSSKRKK